MIIKSIRLKNFRSIREQSVNFDELTVLVGRNGSGKSTVLHAIKTFYEISAPITEEDFFQRDMNSKIEIQIIFSNLKKEEMKEFSTYIVNNELIVTKRISFIDSRFEQKYYASAFQIPEFAEIRKLSKKSDQIGAWNSLIESNKFTTLKVKVRSADQVSELMNEYEKDHKELMKPIEREAQFFGPASIGGGKLDKFTRFVLIPAVREAQDEASGKKGAIYQILDMLVLRKVEARKDIREFKLEFDKKVKELYSSKNLKELSELGDIISKTLSKFAPGAQLKLKWDEINPPDIQLPIAKATLIEDDFEGVIDRKGHGLQRALIMTLLQHLAISSPIEVNLSENSENLEIDLKEKQFFNSPDLILALEEPELYQHPSRSRYLAEILLLLSRKSALENSAQNQIIYTTHSPYFIDLNRFNNIRLVKKAPCKDSNVLNSIFSSFTLEEASKKMKSVCEDINNISIERFRSKAVSVINSIVNEGFFADIVLIVEGLSDLGVFWKLQEIMNKDWSRLGISIIPAMGKNNICYPFIVFKGFNIPTYFVFDADFNCEDSERKNNIKTNHRNLKLTSSEIVDFPITQVNKNWAVFKDNLEEQIKIEIGEKQFLNIRDRVASDLEYDRPKEVTKNIEGSSKMIEFIYKENLHLPTFEKIIDSVTSLKVNSFIEK